MSGVRLSRRGVIAGAAAFCALATDSRATRRLRIGVTLHPYYSYVANIVGDRAEVVPLIPVGFNPHAYEPRGEDIKRLGTLDVVVLNGIGHDDFAERMIRASENPNVPVIEANRDVPLLAAVGQMAQSRGKTISGKVVNSHTFLSITGSITQVQTIARELGRIDPDNAEFFTKNARAYAQRLRKIRAAALAQISEAPSASFRVATIHGAYDYLLREFGLEVTAVVEPAHGVEPSPAQLAKTIEQIKALDVKVIFSELNFPSAYVDTIRRETGVRLYPLSHIIYGAYAPEKFEIEMAENFATVVRAIREEGGATQSASPEAAR
ncbi:zinc ABC transporter substrate-binding protein [Methylopila sp. M107]|uniref:metal ABC transporter solute-binding protein, Zn/Mn family n=1 Tax=Methylopila sp. M107 TaxID=1101190 RepID=UPI0003689B8A|nr:zinc ABC transporter substrate-binding protein [Methylopila sp. M107]